MSLYEDSNQILSLIDINLDNILNRCQINRHQYARNIIERNNSIIDYLGDIIEMIKEDDSLISELFKDIENLNLNISRIERISIKNELKNKIKDLMVESNENDDSEYIRSGIISDILLINNFILYFNDSYNLEISYENNDDLVNNFESNRTYYESHTNNLNLFNMSIIDNVLIENSRNDIILIETVKNTLKLIYFHICKDVIYRIYPIQRSNCVRMLYFDY